jgi:hypothetical protein
MRPLSETLTDLIVFAEQVITRPAMVPNLANNGMLPTLAREVKYADALPAESVRTTRAAMVMIIVLEEFFAGDCEPDERALMLAGATLPWLRGEAWVARRNEKEAGASS